MANKLKKDYNDLSEAARIMRTSTDPKERSEAAAKMGQAGGMHSHDNDYKNRKSNNISNDED